MTTDNATTFNNIDIQQHRNSSKPALIQFRLRVTGPGAEESAPYARPPIRRVDGVVERSFEYRQPLNFTP
jgi:hypothetical protein